MQKKRIAIIIQCLSIGGAQRFAADLSVLLEKAGYEIHVFLQDTSDIAYKYGGQLHSISWYYKMNSPLMPLLFPQYLINTRRLKKKLKIDVSISFMEFSNLINVMSNIGDDIYPVICNYILQNEMTPSKKDDIIEMMFKKRIKNARNILAISKASKDKLDRLYNISDKDKIKYLYIANDIENIKKSAEEPLENHFSDFINEKTFVNFGRIMPQKSLHKLLQAFSIVAGKDADARLIFVGDGDLRKDLEELAVRLKIADRIMFTGFRKNPFPIVSRALAYVMSSSFEGFGMAITEAMSCGISVISTDCLAGPREIIAPGTGGTAQAMEQCEFGILTPPHDGEWSLEFDKSVTELARAMLLLLNDDELNSHYKRQSVKRAENFAPEIITGHWKRLIDGKEN